MELIGPAKSSLANDGVPKGIRARAKKRIFDDKSTIFKGAAFLTKKGSREKWPRENRPRGRGGELRELEVENPNIFCPPATFVP